MECGELIATSAQLVSSIMHSRPRVRRLRWHEQTVESCFEISRITRTGSSKLALEESVYRCRSREMAIGSRLAARQTASRFGTLARVRLWNTLPTTRAQ